MALKDSRWRGFLAASFLAVTFLMMGMPMLPTLGGIALAGAWNLYAASREKRTVAVAKK